MPRYRNDHLKVARHDLNWDDICRRGLQDEVNPPRDEWIRDADGMRMYTRDVAAVGNGTMYPDLVRDMVAATDERLRKLFPHLKVVYHDAVHQQAPEGGLPLFAGDVVVSNDSVQGELFEDQAPEGGSPHLDGGQ